MNNKLKVFSIGFDSQYIREKLGINKDSSNIVVLNNIDEIANYNGDLLIINLDNLKELYNELYYYDQLKYEKYDLYEYDRLNRKRFSKFKYVIIISIDLFFYKYSYKNIYSNILFKDDNSFIDFDKLYNTEIVRIGDVKRGNILKLKEQVDNKKDYFNSKDIMDKFKVSNRWVKRYMKYMNDVYNNIGYSYSKRKWYKVEK